MLMVHRALAKALRAACEGWRGKSFSDSNNDSCGNLVGVPNGSQLRGT